MRTYLRMLAKTLRPSSTPSSSTSSDLLEKDHVGGLFGDVDRGIDADSDVGGAQRWRIVDPVAHEADGVLARLQGLDDSLLVRGETRANSVVVSAASASCSSVISSTSPPSSTRSVASPTSLQILRATRSLSPVTTLTDTPCCSQRRDGAAGASPWADRETRRSR